MKRLMAFDYLRVLLIVLVIIFHSVVFVSLAMHLPQQSQFISFNQWIVQLAIPTHKLLQGVFYSYLFIMPAFFLLAGFFARLSLDKHGMKNFMVNRTLKIAIPFLFLWLWKVPIYLLLMAWVYFFSHGFGAMLLQRVQLQLQQVGGCWAYLNDLSYAWFLYDLLWLYGASLVLFYLTQRWPLLQRLVRHGDQWLLKFFVTPWRTVAIALLATLLLRNHFSAGVLPFDGRLNSPLALGLYYALWYGLGWWLSFYQAHFLKFFKYSGFALVLSLGCYCIYMHSFFSSVSGFYYYIGLFVNQLSTALVVFSLIDLAWRYGTKPVRALRYVSVASYWLYLSHIPLIFLCLSLLPHRPAYYYSYCLVVSVSALVLGLVSYQWLVRHSWLNAFLGEK